MKPNRPRGASLMASIQKAKAAAPAPQAEREEANKWSDCEPKPEPREMTQTEYEVEYAKLCEKYRELLKFKVGAAPAETAGEMTAEQLAVDICRELYDRFVMGGWQPEESHGYVRDIAEAFAKQRVEQVERNVNAIVTLLYAKCSQKEWLLMPPQFHAAREKVADLERERRVTHIIVAQGEGAGVQLVTGEVHEELHKFMCCCGKRWENCETQDDIRRIDDSDSWSVDEDGQPFGISWDYETGTTFLYSLGADTLAAELNEEILRGDNNFDEAEKYKDRAEAAESELREMREALDPLKNLPISCGFTQTQADVCGRVIKSVRRLLARKAGS